MFRKIFAAVAVDSTKEAEKNVFYSVLNRI